MELWSACMGTLFIWHVIWWVLGKHHRKSLKSMHQSPCSKFHYISARGSVPISYAGKSPIFSLIDLTHTKRCQFLFQSPEIEMGSHTHENWHLRCNVMQWCWQNAVLSLSQNLSQAISEGTSLLVLVILLSYAPHVVFPWRCIAFVYDLISLSSCNVIPSQIVFLLQLHNMRFCWSSEYSNYGIRYTFLIKESGGQQMHHSQPSSF